MSIPDGPPVISTARLRLRAPTLEDAPRIAALANDPGVARMTTRMPHPYGLSDAEAFLQACERRDVAKEHIFALDHDDEGLVGMLGFHPDDDGRVELGYWLGRPYWGQGLATEAASGALVWAGEGWRRRYLVAGHFADNPASGQVLCKTGFLYTGEVLPRHSLARGETAATRMMVWLA
ncbi:GNAT family N-acetyltransferase [Phenylobacterium sp.]|uniref:GNAT family N-acetyltransferase n=1 Tax=Phenylobacterium sp. TaxID=1871053 RepID=UPI00272FE734|nr:GNAT family N-acetyltransferase [Phenylobacterium sp.]MDP1618946.1 GNAT family N-acetyltransferase [Phenylobacterium sp.]MDP1987674.1 GNAT family N-acetyltransferase [Phenylobacterium sp.]